VEDFEDVHLVILTRPALLHPLTPSSGGAQDGRSNIAGLETAKAEAGTGRTDDKLKASHAAKIRDQQHQVDARQWELDDSRHSGESSKKIVKRQRKLDDA
jgi:hypothetical protein